MKLVINVDEYKIESCKRRKKEGWNEWYHNMILEGNPFNDELVKELENIKQEMKHEIVKIEEHGKLNNYKRCEQEGIRTAIICIDKHIAEIKGDSR